MTAPLVSVVLPVFDAEATIEGAVTSITGQTLDDLEIVVVDDGSTDATPEILGDLASSDRRIRLYTETHRGVLAAAQVALANAVGTYIARMDADDLAMSTKLERQVELLSTAPDLSVASCLVEVLEPDPDREGFSRYIDWVNSCVTPEDIRRELFIELAVPNPTTMVRRDELVELGGYLDTAWPEDYELWLRINHAGRHMAKVPEMLHRWADRPDRLTRTDPRYSVENFIRAKVHYLMAGPLHTGRPVVHWGAGKMGRRISKHLLREGVDLVAFVDIDDRKIGGTVRAVPVLDAAELPALRARLDDPLILVGVPSRKARDLIRARLGGWGLAETIDYWCVA